MDKYVIFVGIFTVLRCFSQMMPTKRIRKSQKRRTKRLYQEGVDDEVKGVPMLRDKTETVNILASAQKK